MLFLRNLSEWKMKNLIMYMYLEQCFWKWSWHYITYVMLDLQIKCTLWAKWKQHFHNIYFQDQKFVCLNIGICCKWFTGYSKSHTGSYHLPSRSKSFNKRTKLWKWIIFDLQNRKKVLPKYDSIWININNSICLQANLTYLSFF